MLPLTEGMVALVTLGLVAYFYKNKKKIKNYPPGPWGFPILGHLPFFGSNPAQKFVEWTKIYGPIFSVRFGGVKTVILNDMKIIREAFSMPEFSGRPLLPVLVEVSNRKGIGFTDGPKQVEQRKFAGETLKEFGVGSPSIELRMQEEITSFLENLKSKLQKLDGKPLKMNNLFKFALINSLWGSIMGGRFEEKDPTLTNLIEVIDQGADTNGSVVAQLFWFFPWVAKLGNFFGYNPPVHAFQSIYKFIEKEIEKLRPSHVPGQRKHFTDAYFDKVAATMDPHSSFHESDKQQGITTGDIMMAAIDAQIKNLDWLMIYMARNPEIQLKLQEEIDNVIGLDKCRSPSLADRQNMPFTNAVIEELLRKGTLVPFGVFHRTVQDVEFHGYRIPKNTMVIANYYAVHLNPEIWEDPERFDPNRFLNDEGQFRKSDKMEMAPFGVGKRMCLGEGFSRDQLFLLVTNFFREFNLCCSSEKLPSLELIFGFASQPHPFELFVRQR